MEKGSAEGAGRVFVMAWLRADVRDQRPATLGSCTDEREMQQTQGVSEPAIGGALHLML